MGKRNRVIKDKAFMSQRYGFIPFKNQGRKD